MADANRSPVLAQRVTRLAGALSALVGLLALAIRAELTELESAPGIISSVPVALGLLLGGTGLCIVAKRGMERLVQALAVCEILIALVMLSSHGATAFLPVAELPHLLALAYGPPAGALCVLLHGLALLLSAAAAGPPWRSPAVATTGSAILALALVSLVANALDVELENQPWEVGAVYLPSFSALGLVLLGLGLFGLATMLVPMHRSRRAPWLPVSIGIGLTIFTLIVWWELTLFERQHAEQIVASAAIGIRTHLAAQVRAEVDRGERMANRWEMSGGTPRELWEADAAGYAGDLPSLVEILWVDADFTPRWGIPFSADEPRWAAYATSPRVGPSLAAARDERRATLSPSYLTPDRTLAFLISVPLFIGPYFDGLLITTFSVPEFLRGALSDSILQGYVATVRDSGVTVYGTEKASRNASGSATVRIALDGLDWQLNVRPRAGSPAQIRSNLPEATLIAGLLLSALIMLSVRLGQMAAERARELEALNSALERRVAARTAELQRAMVEVERSNQELEQFAYVASHDLQEPLRMISSYVQLLARRYKGRLDTDADEFIGYAVDGAERMKRLINDLLAYSRLGANGKPHRRVETSHILQLVLSNLEFAIRDAAAEVTAEELPAVQGDETQLVQLFQNLVANALKFRTATPPRVHIAAHRDGPHWHFTIQDNGIGIHPQYADRIFVIFRRLHTQSEYPGTGIGLAVCRKIVDRHGGRIWVDSQPDQGSTFHFLLPADVAPTTADTEN